MVDDYDILKTDNILHELLWNQLFLNEQTFYGPMLRTHGLDKAHSQTVPMENSISEGKRPMENSTVILPVADGKKSVLSAETNIFGNDSDSILDRNDIFNEEIAIFKIYLDSILDDYETKSSDIENIASTFQKSGAFSKNDSEYNVAASIDTKAETTPLESQETIQNTIKVEIVEFSNGAGVKFECPNCIRTFTSKESLELHKITCLEKQYIQVGDRFRCMYCRKQFKRKRGLTMHYESGRCRKNYTNTRFKQPIFECSICNRTFSSKTGLNDHRLRRRCPCAKKAYPKACIG